MTQRRLKHFGWGREGDGLTSAEEAFVLGRIEQRLGLLADGDGPDMQPLAVAAIVLGLVATAAWTAFLVFELLRATGLL